MSWQPTSSEHSGASLPSRGRPRLTVCLIVRDNAHTIIPCLESIRPWVDEIIVVDTGSLDETPQLCRQLGARVSVFPWIDDFSAARNASLDQASGEWIFWMDSDDTISPENGARLRALADGEHAAAVLGYVLQVHCPGQGEGENDDVTVVDHVKLFRNLPGLRFEGRIHEQVLGNIRKLGGTVAWTDIFVTHSGSDQSPAGKRRKVERDLRILALDLAERPEHPFVLFNLGMTYHDLQEDEQAGHWLRRCLAVSHAEESHVRKAYALLISSLTRLRSWDEAQAACTAGRDLFPQDPEILFRAGLLAQAQGKPEAAVEAYREVLRAREERHFSSLDPGITGFKTRHNLALALAELGEHDLAELECRRILDERPHYGPAWRALGENLLSSQRLVTLDLELSLRQNILPLRADSLLLEAKLWQRRNRPAERRQCLELAAREYPEHLGCLELVCQARFQAGEWEGAEEKLSALTQKCPQDGAAWHNLGIVYAQLGKRAAARAAWQESVRVRPDAPQTRRYLEALQEPGAPEQ